MLRSAIYGIGLLSILLLLQVTPINAAILTVTCGSGTYPTIMSAVIPASPGDTIVIRPCTYPENVTISSKNSLHLVATDSALFGTEPSGVGSAPVGLMPIIDGGGVGPCLTIENSTRVSITGLAMTSCLGPGIAVDSSDFAKLHANYIGGFSGTGIEVQNSGAPIITSNWIRQVSDHGVHLSTVNSGVVSDNTIEGLFGPGATGVLIDGGTERSHVLRNEISSSMMSGIHDAGLATRIERNTVQGNCNGPGYVSCVCNEILLDASSVAADVVGNSVSGSPVDLCTAVGWDVADNF